MKILEKLKDVFRGRSGTRPLTQRDALRSIYDIPIYVEGKVPDLTGFEEMQGLAVDAYPYQQGEPRHDAEDIGDYSLAEAAKEQAIRTVACHYNITDRQAYNQFDICIVPSMSYHGKIMARRRN